jgi:hypothetical protein
MYLDSLALAHNNRPQHRPMQATHDTGGALRGTIRSALNVSGFEIGQHHHYIIITTTTAIIIVIIITTITIIIITTITSSSPPPPPSSSPPLPPS